MTTNIRPQYKDPGQYGAFAQDYDSILVPRYFAAPARDLLKMVDLKPGSRVLDVGTGTGTALDYCVRAGEVPRLVVGLDPSPGMLAVARTKGHGSIAAGGAPELPFRSGSFDSVMAGFVLSHLQTVEDSLHDMVRVLAPGGCLAVSGWGTHNDAYISAWMETAGEFVDNERLVQEVSAAMPHASTFEAVDDLELALKSAGLIATRARISTYRASVSAEDYVTARASLVHSRMMAEEVGEAEFQRFLTRMLKRLIREFGETISYSTVVNFASGKKPS